MLYRTLLPIRISGHSIIPGYVFPRYKGTEETERKGFHCHTRKYFGFSVDATWWAIPVTAILYDLSAFTRAHRLLQPHGQCTIQ